MVDGVWELLADAGPGVSSVTTGGSADCISPVMLRKSPSLVVIVSGMRAWGSGRSFACCESPWQWSEVSMSMNGRRGH